MENSTFAKTLYQPLAVYIQTLLEEFNHIPEDRKEVLRKLTSFIKQRLEIHQRVNLVFICTHNSRRSHMAQIWAQTAAYCYGITGINTYSGGTEATSFNPRAVKAIQQAGFVVEQTGDEHNPTYLVKFTGTQQPMKAFSKVYDAEGNPSHNFIAIMTCSHANENCPFIPGAALRIPVDYDDPKEFDSTMQESTAYTERVRQIGREMFYLFNNVADGKSHPD